MTRESFNINLFFFGAMLALWKEVAILQAFTPVDVFVLLFKARLHEPGHLEES